MNQEKDHAFDNSSTKKIFEFLKIIICFTFINFFFFIIFFLEKEAKKEEKKKAESEDEDADMGFGLFD